MSIVLGIFVFFATYAVALAVLSVSVGMLTDWGGWHYILFRLQPYKTLMRLLAIAVAVWAGLATFEALA